MMQAADLGNRDDPSFSWRFYCPPYRRITLQGTVRARGVVVVHVLGKDLPEVDCIPHDDVIRALPAD